jgi:hypothetical protein
MTGGGKRSEKAEGKRPEHTEQENPSDTSDDSNHADPCAGTSHGHPRHQIQFEIKTKVKKVESEAQPETLKIAGTFTFKVGGSFFFSIISMLLISVSVSVLGIIGVAKIREKSTFIKCQVPGCRFSRARCWHSATL